MCKNVFAPRRLRFYEHEVGAVETVKEITSRHLTTSLIIQKIIIITLKLRAGGGESVPSNQSQSAPCPAGCGAGAADQNAVKLPDHAHRAVHH